MDFVPQMPIYIKATSDTWGERESVTVSYGDDIIASFSTVADCPEDNTCSRMGIAVEIMNMLSYLGIDVRFSQTQED